MDRTILTIRTSADCVVKRVERLRSGERRLVKAVAPGANRDAGLARLGAECAFLAGLPGPGFLAPLGPVAPDGVAEYDDVQCSLAQYLAANRTLPAARVAQVGVVAATALKALHKAGFGHGAVSTHTLFVTPGGSVVFGDFTGYALANPVLAEPDPLPPYRAPEQFDASHGPLGPHADLYALGFLLIELLVGPLLHEAYGIERGADPDAWHADAGRPLGRWREMVPAAPAGLLDAIDRFVPKPLNDRMRSCPTVADALDALEPFAAMTPLPAYHPAKPTAERPAAVVVRPTGRVRTGTLPKRPTHKPVLVLTPLTPGARGVGVSPNRPCLIGRADTCTVTVDRPDVSRKHCLIVCESDGFWRAHDLGSAGRTFVNGKEIARARLYPDDELHCGNAGWKVTLEYGKSADSRKRFDQFRIRGRIRVGGTNGDLYRAEWLPHGNKTVALRLFPKDFQYDERALRRFVRGVPEAAAVRHPHLARVYRGGFRNEGADRAWFLASEYLPGGSLRDRLANGTIEPFAAVDAVRQAALGAAVVNARGWVHRTINPACVLFAADGTAKLGDLTLARPATADGSSTYDDATGTDDEFQAPEVRTGGAPLTAASDVYSLGRCLEKALQKTCLPAVATVVRRATAAEPLDRYADAAAFAEALTRCA